MYFINASLYSDDFKQYLKSLTFYIRTVSNNKETVEYLELESSMNRLFTDLFYISTVSDDYQLINMDNKNTYELMCNLLNDYQIIWQDICDQIFIKSKTYKSIPKKQKILMAGIVIPVFI